MGEGQELLVSFSLWGVSGYLCYLELFLRTTCLSSIYSITDLYQFGLMYNYWYFGLYTNSTLFIYFAQVVPALEIGCPFGWLLCPVDMPPSFCLFLFVCFEHFHTFYTTEYSKLILCFSCLSPRMSIGKWYFEMKIGVLGMLIADGTHSNFNRESLL